MADSIRKKFSNNSNAKSFMDHLRPGEILSNNRNSIMVYDKNGNILAAFSYMKEGSLVGLNAKKIPVKGIYDLSFCAEAVKKGLIVSGITSVKQGCKQLVANIPVKDEQGKVIMVVSAAIDQDIIDHCAKMIKNGGYTEGSYEASVARMTERNQIVPLAESPQMKLIIKRINNVAKTDSTLMLLGESGTGKDILARYAHRVSSRAGGPFIPVNCAAIPQELLEAEFFGYEGGSFTGANAGGKAGLFEIADQGTLFLDEIGEMPLLMQSKLLRALDIREIKRVGGTTFNRVNVRLIVATNRNLKEMIQQKLFRRDLYYRLSVVPIHIPPLRERPEDIRAFAYRFLNQMNKKYALNKELPPRLIESLLNYSWPGNVRELRNVIERYAVYDDTELYLDAVDPDVIKSTVANVDISEKKYRGPLKSAIKRLEKDYISEMLVECNGKLGETAKKLGIHRSMLYKKMKELDIKK